MSWILEEKIEDAYAAYLRANLPGSMRVYVGWTDEEIQYPCAVCHAGSSDNLDDETTFNGHRRVPVKIAVISEATPELDAGGKQVRSSRERNSDARGPVLSALAKTALHEDLNDMNIAGVKFSQAHMTAMTRSIEGRHFVSEIIVDTIANPTAA